jgi:hypothetical protein
MSNVLHLQRLRHGDQLHPLLPAQALPELQPGLVVAQHEQVAAVNAHAHQREHAAPYQRFADALPAVRFGHGQVMDVTVPPIAAAQRRSDDLSLVDGDVAQIWVALEESV